VRSKMSRRVLLQRNAAHIYFHALFRRNMRPDLTSSIGSSRRNAIPCSPVDNGEIVIQPSPICIILTRSF
jgi:hypothetical protein